MTTQNKVSDCKHRTPAMRVKGGYGFCAVGAKLEKTEKGVCPYHGNMSAMGCPFCVPKKKVREAKV